MLKKAPLLLVATLALTPACASQQYSTPEVADVVMPARQGLQVGDIDQEDLAVVHNERVAGFWGEPGYLVRIGVEEFVVHRPEDGKIVARNEVEGRLVSVSVSPRGDFACVLHGPTGRGARLGLYDMELGEWRWQESLTGTGYMVVAGVDKCLVGYEGDQSPEVFEAPDGKVRIRLMDTPPEPMGIFTSPDGHRQWWVSPVENFQPAAGQEPGTRWEVTQVEIRSWTYEGQGIARCLEADEGQIRAVGNTDADNSAFAEMARRAQMGYGADGCEPADVNERMRFADGQHRLDRTIPDDGGEALASRGTPEIEGNLGEMERVEQDPSAPRSEGEMERRGDPGSRAEEIARQGRTSDGDESSENRTLRREGLSEELGERRVPSQGSVIRRGQREIRRLSTPVEINPAR